MTQPRAMTGRLLPRIAGIIRQYRYAISALDQVVLSLFAFALNLALIRALSAADFGVVSLWMGISLLAIGVQNALVNGPLNVQLPTEPDPAVQRQLASAVAAVNLLTIAGAAAIVTIVVLVSDAEWAPKHMVTALTIPLFIAAGMYREYARNMAFGEHNSAMLLWTDGPYVAVTGACVLAMLIRPDQFANLAAAFVAMSAGCVVSQLCLRFFYGYRQERLFRPGWVSAYLRIARELGWSLVGVIANHVETRSYVYIVTSLVGVSALGAINAIGVLFRPVNVLMNGWARSALPYLAKALADHQLGKFDRTVGLALSAAAVGSVVLGVALWFLWGPLDAYLLAGKYADGSLLLVPWAIASGAMVLRYVVGVALQAARDYKFLANVQIFCGILSAAATAGLIVAGGYGWTMYGIAIGNGLCFVLMMDRLLRVRRRLLAEAADGAAPARQS